MNLKKYPNFLSVDDLVHLGLYESSKQFYNAYLNNNTPPCLLIGKRRLFPKEALQDWLEDKKYEKVEKPFATLPLIPDSKHRAVKKNRYQTLGGVSKVNEDLTDYKFSDLMDYLTEPFKFLKYVADDLDVCPSSVKRLCFLLKIPMFKLNMTENNRPGHILIRASDVSEIVKELESN